MLIPGSGLGPGAVLPVGSWTWSNPYPTAQTNPPYSYCARTPTRSMSITTEFDFSATLISRDRIKKSIGKAHDSSCAALIFESCLWDSLHIYANARLPYLFMHTTLGLTKRTVAAYESWGGSTVAKSICGKRIRPAVRVLMRNADVLAEDLLYKLRAWTSITTCHYSYASKPTPN